MSRYPEAPGHHGEDTSVIAARSMHDQARTDRESVERVFLQHGSLTADEAAQLLRWDDVYRARRRVTELKQQGRLHDTGERRRTASGRPAQVLTIQPVQMEMWK